MKVISISSMPKKKNNTQPKAILKKMTTLQKQLVTLQKDQDKLLKDFKKAITKTQKNKEE